MKYSDLKIGMEVYDKNYVKCTILSFTETEVRMEDSIGLISSPIHYLKKIKNDKLRCIVQ